MLYNRKSIILNYFTGIIVFIIASLSSYIASSQSIPNGDFEYWEENGPYEDPSGWGTSNWSFYGILSFNTVTRYNADPYSGASAVQLVTKEETSGGEKVKVSGILTLGTFDINIVSRTAAVNGGVLYHKRPEKVTGYYKYAPQGNDSCVFFITLFKWNIFKNERDTIASSWYKGERADTWTKFEFPVNYRSDETPDSLNIIFSSSDTSIFEEGSTLWIDSILIIDDADTVSIEEGVDILVYPNPVYTKLSVINPLTENYTVYIYSGEGKRVYLMENKGYLHEIDFTGMSPGIYYVRIDTPSKHILKKIIKPI